MDQTTRFFLKNESITFCYFSIFGYDLELLRPIVSDLMFNYKETLKLRKDLTPTRKINSDTMYLFKKVIRYLKIM